MTIDHDRISKILGSEPLPMAEELARLRAENERLRAGLREIRDTKGDFDGYRVYEIARRILGREEGDEP